MAVQNQNPFAISLGEEDLDILGQVADLTADRDPESATNSDLPVGVYHGALLGGTFGKTASGDKLKFTYSFTIIGGDYHGRNRKITRVIKTDDGGDSYLRLRNELRTFGVDAIKPADIVEQLSVTELIECGITVTAGSKAGSVFYNLVSLDALAEYEE
jgi:hypothetical protein